MINKQKTLVILDAHAIIHRAYHALPAFATSDGEPTGALYGVVTMTLKIIETFKPDDIVAAFDLPKPTFRHQVYDAYKAGRAKADDALIVQLQSARGLFEAFGIAVKDAEGFEADDVIGTLVEQHKNTPGQRIIIASGDMDTMQLVEGEAVQVFTLKKGLNDTILYDEEAVVTRYGFSPKQLVDYKGLRGDPSDNIIGVPGIGEKTATMILTEFGSIEGLYEAIKKDRTTVIKAGFSERIVSLLEEHEEDALFSKTLATIRRDAPVSCDLSAINYKESVDTEKLLALFDKYEFRSLKPKIKTLFGVAEEESPEVVIDQALLHESAIALWVLYSEHTNATYETILQKTKAKTLEEAHKILMEELKKRNSLTVFERIEKPLIPIIDDMEKWGIGVDSVALNEMVESLEKRISEIETAAAQFSGGTVNLSSPKQLSVLLFDTLGLKPKGKRKESGAFTTNAETLEGLREAHPIIPLILEHRELQKIVSTYGASLLEHVKEDGRIHAQFLQHGTTTGRFSSANPNMQNIPASGEWGKKVRHAFVASPGYVFVGCDYSQIELRVLAILSKDKTLVDTFVRGDDIHTSVAMAVFGVQKKDITADMRRSAKVINFGIIYGMGVQALQKKLGTTKEKAQTFYDEYFEAFPTIRTYLESVKESARALGYTQTLFGRRRYFPTINSGPGFLRAFAERMATNAPIQGSAADIIKLAILAVNNNLKEKGYIKDAHLVLQVHDELVYEVKEEIVEEVKTCIVDSMERVLDMFPPEHEIPPVPLVVSLATGERLDQLK